MTGGAGNDVLFGLGGDDRVSGEQDDDVLRGGDGSDVLAGDMGNDSLEGESGDDVLYGGPGDDQLLGGDGADVYRFNVGDGADSISDSNAPGERSRVVFGPGITSSSINLSASFSQILVLPGSTTDALTIGASAEDVFGPRAVDRFEFADGSSITYTELVARGFNIEGTPFDDWLIGTSVADRISGGVGNDRLEGGAGDDTYFFNVGDGVDTIDDTAAIGAGNMVVFGAAITSDATHVKLVDHPIDPALSSLSVELGTSGEGIRFGHFDPNNALGLHAVDRFQFADGLTLTYDELLARGIEVTGTTGDEALRGTNVTDQINGLAGNDTLRGGEGSDVYLFGRGSGQDLVIDRQGDVDAVRFAADVAPADVTVARIGHDLVLTIADTSDRLRLSFFFLAPALQIEQVQFANGTVWDTAFLKALTQGTSIIGTGGSDALVGTNGDDHIAGLAGTDSIAALSGHDVLDGGAGADQLNGGLGDDTYLVDDAGDVVFEQPHEGTDAVVTTVSLQLPEYVENLTLAGTDAINGIGNALNNVLIGNHAANVLAGGLGDDTYVIDASDMVVEHANGGVDTVVTDQTHTLGADLENVTLIGSAPLRGTRNGLNNVLRADGSVSTLAGGAGDDTYVLGFNGDDDVLVETATGGIDTVLASNNYRLPGHVENLINIDPRVPDFATFTLSSGSSGVSVSGFGNELDNRLVGGRANNALDGGLGADTMLGGAGDDLYIVDNSNDLVIELAGEGVDIVEASSSYELPANVEYLTLVGTEAVNGTGNALNNIILGNSASNVLDGGAGNDILNGEEGADTFFLGVGSGQDIVADTTQTGAVDTIQIAAALAPSDVMVFQRGGDVTLALNNTTDELTIANFYGFSNQEFKQVRFADGTLWNEAELRARAVTVGETISGAGANETLIGSAGHDVLIGNAGDDALAGGLGNDWLYGDATFQSPFRPQVIGNDTLAGGAGDDTLMDLRGTNHFDGGAGNDQLFLGTANDTVLFGRGSGNDTAYFDGNGSDLDLIELSADLTASDVILTRRYPDSHVLI